MVYSANREREEDWFCSQVSIYYVYPVCDHYDFQEASTKLQLSASMYDESQIKLKIIYFIK